MLLTISTQFILFNLNTIRSLLIDGKNTRYTLRGIFISYKGYKTSLILSHQQDASTNIRKLALLSLS